MSKAYDYPFRGDFSLTVSVDIDYRWKKLWFKKVVEYKQATIHETIDELEQIGKKWLGEFMINFLHDRWLSDDDLTLLSMKPETLKDVVNTIVLTRYRWVIDKDMLEKPDNTPKEVAWVPYCAILALVAEKLHIDPITFQDNYTIEQMGYLLGWVEYWVNAQSKEWQEANKKKYGRDEAYDNMLIDKLRNL